MELPPAYDPIWSDLVTGKIKHPLNFLGAKIMLGRLIRSTSKDPSPHNIQSCIDQLRNLYAQHTNLPTVKHDLEHLFCK